VFSNTALGISKFIDVAKLGLGIMYFDHIMFMPIQQGLLNSENMVTDRLLTVNMINNNIILYRQLSENVFKELRK